MFSVEQPESLLRFGFKFGRGGAHAARTMMLAELRRLFDVTGEAALCADYRTAVVDSNVLDKPTVKARKLTYEYLRDLYALWPGEPGLEALATQECFGYAGKVFVTVSRLSDHERLSRHALVQM